MTQKTYFFDSDPGGGDYKASYTDDELALFFDLLHNYDRRLALIAFQEYATYGDPVDINGNDFRLFACCALVDGRIYINDATITLPTAGVNGHYAVVLRRDDSGGAGDQTVRAALLFSAVGAPAPTQTAATWECVIARAEVKAGTLDASTLAFYWRPFPFNMTMPFRKGTDEKDWTEADTSVDSQLYPTYKPMVQAGVIAHTATGAAATITVPFPRYFRSDTKPLVFVTPYNLSGGTPSHANIIRITLSSPYFFSISVDLDTGIEGFHWFAIGEDNNDELQY